MLPRAPDAGAAASPGRVVDVLQTIQVPTTRDLALIPGTAPRSRSLPPRPALGLGPHATYTRGPAPAPASAPAC